MLFLGIKAEHHLDQGSLPQIAPWA